MSVAFSLSIDATKVPQVIEASTGYKAIIGGEYPNHLIDIKGKSKEEVDAILDGKDKRYGVLEEATEVKVAIATFQNCPPGLPPSEIIAARPQSNNESNDFVKEMEVVATSISTLKQGRFSNFTVDGVSCESKHVWQCICLFLTCKANHTGATDPKHNAKL